MSDSTASGISLARHEEVKADLQAQVDELKGLLAEHLYAPDTQKIAEWEDLSRRSKVALKPEEKT